MWGGARRYSKLYGFNRAAFFCRRGVNDFVKFIPASITLVRFPVHVLPGVVMFAGGTVGS